MIICSLSDYINSLNKQGKKDFLRFYLKHGGSALDLSELINELQMDPSISLEELLETDFYSIMTRSDALLPNSSAHFQSTQFEIFKYILNHIDWSSDDIFCDVGCGKGSTLFFALLMGFNKVKGIEYSQILLDICDKNLSKINMRENSELICADAGTIDVKFLSDISIFYLFNPFNGDVLRSFIRQLLLSRGNATKAVKIIYYHDIHNNIFSELNIMPKIKFTTQGANVSIYYL